MFLLPQRLIQGVELFNIKQNEDLKHYNKLMAEVGRTVRILSQREFMVAGAVAPANEFGEGVVKPDAFYVYVTYERTQFSPYKPMFELIRSATDGKYKAAQDDNLVITVGPGDTNQSVLEKIEALDGRTIQYDPENIVIDVTAETVAATKKAGRKVSKSRSASTAQTKKPSSTSKSKDKGSGAQRAKNKEGGTKAGKSPRSKARE